MTPSFGQTPSDIRRNHALLTPESHEWITQPDWPGAEIAFLISPDMGAKFAMGLVRSKGGLTGIAPAPTGIARFVFVLEGAVTLSTGQELTTEGYAFLPPETDATLSSPAGVSLLLMEWRFVARGEIPAPVFGHVKDIQGTPLRGDDWLMVQKMLPTDAGFDGEVNIMNFHPGASLAYVETHFMEHGLLMLDGGGVYRLDDRWYPVGKGDAIWMGPHVPQWFGALGRTPSRYLIYKNYNRSPLAAR
ncbi:(S)-ureidoglycine aminohydrolase [Tropicibacter naphthalenivorans]|uniref:Putative allantoin catabolism protein n=1 Tax=Tropicibacter naphthalenivorans TaxID=441103 RepID=A0A0P1GVX5_9RHOB|nr:(S)-ureidoglycine aminohydrolase [Tropicibacter naphthalenivorans]CUH80667.1 putative allantoin catabolism protein [Tropicibacter naphthalenivorans]SMC89244.1 (S)-ureidoglycine aminohydrolase [Tropicibacter naphthalenivorans]